MRKKDAAPETRGQLYRLTVTEKQLRVIQTALEWFFRLQMGQFSEYTNEVALCGYVYNKDDPNNREEFDKYIRRRNLGRSMFEAAYRVAHPWIYNTGKTDDMMTAEDTWRVIRHYFWEQRPEPKDHWIVDADKPIFLTCDGHKVQIEQVE